MLDIKTDIDAALAKFRAALDPKQLPFAAARALTRTAVEIQAQVREEMPQRFTLRRQWIVQGIRVERATKDNLRASVFTMDEFMGRQERGGTKAPKQDQHLAIPMPAVRRTKRDLIREADLPKNLGRAEITKTLRNGKTITRKGAGGAAFKTEVNGRLFLVRRRNGKLEFLYLLVPRADIQKRLGLEEIGTRVGRARFAQLLRESWEDAVRTAR